MVDADVRIYVQEVRAVHTAAGDGGMRAAVRLPEMRRACPPCPPDRTRLPHHVGRSASGRRKVRAHHRRIARPAAILAPSWIVQERETCQGESVSASLTESRVASSLKHRRAASGYCASAMLGGPNRVAAVGAAQAGQRPSRGTETLVGLDRGRGPVSMADTKRWCTVGTRPARSGAGQAILHAQR